MRLFTAAALLLGAQLWVPAASGASASFRVGTVEFELDIPPGYCLPTGAQVEFARRLAAGDTANVTHMTLFSCGPRPSGDRTDPTLDYILVKTPTSLLDVPVSREQLLVGLGEAFENPAFKEGLRTGKFADEAEKSVSRSIGRPFDLSGNVRPLGRDQSCAYLGGTVEVKTPVKSYAIANGTCMTAVGGRAVATFWYGPDTSSAGIRRLLDKAKGLALAIRRRPAR